MALSRRKEVPISRVLALLDSASLDARLGACQAVAQLKDRAASAVPALRKALHADDLWLRIKAADALAAIGKPAMEAVPEMLELLAQVDPQRDPRGMQQRYLTFALFGSRDGLLGRSLESVDRNQIYAAVRAGLKNDDGNARSTFGSVYHNLSAEEIKPLLPTILQAVVKPAPSGEMFADGIRVDGLRVLAAHHVAEGMSACVEYLRTQNPWESQIRTPELTKILVSYGAQAKAVIPELKRIAESFAAGEPDFPKDLSLKKAAAVREAIRQLEGAGQTYDNNPHGVKVFILAGQSNMVGHGKAEEGVGDVAGAIGSLRHMVKTDPTNYGRLVDGSGNWVTRGNVKVWWRDSDITEPRAVIKGDLKLGYAQNRNATWFGPEYAFGWVVGDFYPNNPVLIIKTAWGGKSLHVDFRPPSAVAARGGVVGPYYTGMIEDVRDALSNLGSEFPEFAGKGYQIAGFGWHQGWNDRSDATASAAYEANLVDLIHDLRTEFSRPNLPISIATTGMAPPGAAGDYPTYTAVELAQLAVANPANHPEFKGTVVTDDTRYYWRDASVSPSNFDYHWNHNGESHYLIGKGMGEGMTRILPPP